MPATTDKREKAREVVDILEEISVLLVRKQNPRYSIIQMFSYSPSVLEHATWQNSTIALRITYWKRSQSGGFGGECYEYAEQNKTLIELQNAILELRRETQDLQLEPGLSDWKQLATKLPMTSILCSIHSHASFVGLRSSMISLQPRLTRTKAPWCAYLCWNILTGETRVLLLKSNQGE